jgi:hypothetical protein
MPTTLSKGFKLPITGERDWYDTLEDNITQLNSHDHDGTDSEAISTKYLSKSTATLASGDWAAVAGHSGTYKQTVTVPSGYAVNTMEAKFYVTAGGQAGYEVHPTIRKASATTYDVFTNDNSVGYTVVYG